MHLVNRMKPVLVLAVVAALLGGTHLSLAAQATGSIRGKVVEAGTQKPLSGVQVFIPNSGRGTMTNADGDYMLLNAPVGAQKVRATLIGYSSSDRNVQVSAGGTTAVNFNLSPAAIALDGLVVTALGQTTTKRELGTAQQTVKGSDIVEAQKTSFVNALAGRVAGVEVVSTSGVPGASSSITIRGVSSISSSNQPLMVVDGLPISNKTMGTGVFAAGGGSATAFDNRGVDFTNRGADINPEDIESLVVLKGPEASALYGIDAANGAIVITTKRGKAGTGGLEYSNSFRVESVNTRPEIQRVYGPSAVGSESFLYWGAPYQAGTQFYDNVDGFFQTALTQRHDLSFSGASLDNKLNYRISGGLIRQKGVVPGSDYNRVQRDGRLAGPGDQLAEGGPVDAVQLRRQRPDLQGLRRPADRPAGLAADRQRQRLAHPGGHASLRDRPGQRRRSTTRTSASTRTRSTR